MPETDRYEVWTEYAQGAVYESTHETEAEAETEAERIRTEHHKSTSVRPEFWQEFYPEAGA